MAAHRRQTGAVSADIAFEQKHIQQHRDVVEAMKMLCQAHPVDADHAVGFDIDLRGAFDVGSAQAGCRLDLIP